MIGPPGGSFGGVGALRGRVGTFEPGGPRGCICWGWTRVPGGGGVYVLNVCGLGESIAGALWVCCRGPDPVYDEEECDMILLNED